ncbi:MAG: cohesin domain-containing protein, partial [Candidatus Krumholzibacteriota bacterium]
APDPVIVGAFSGDAQVAISVPGGISHEPYNGVINAPYILQASQDKDFTVEVKFSSTLPDTSYGEQGIIVLQDNQTWLRFDFNSTETAIRAFGTTDGNTPTIFDGGVGIPGDQPLYLRVQRTGDLWDMYYSSDGSAWTLAGSLTYNLTVTGVGLFAGNHSPNGTSAPPFTTFVDYFSNTVDAVVEPDDQDLNSIYITTSGLGSVAKSPDQAVYTCGDPVQLTATPDVDWVFTGWSGDLSGTDNPATITMDRPRHVTANFAPTSGTVIVANTSGVPGISTGLPCATGVPVEILRDSGTDIRGFTVTFGLTNLDLCDGILSITEGDYLSSISATSFNPIDNLDGTYDVDIAILGEPCGATALTGTLFTLDVTNTIPDGTGTIDITNVELRDCLNAPIAAAAGGPADILIDTTAPTGVTNLAFSKVMLDNAPGNVTEVDISWTDSVDPDAATVSVYRKGFGGYPEYDDGGGSAPTLPVNPIAEGWELVNVVPAGAETTTDLATTRDYWYFCARAADALGNQSTAVMTTGVLNYLLGDVSDGGDPILDGDNKVWTDDLTLLGAHYGTSDGQPLYLNNLDIGPSSDMSVDGLPTTDDMIEFEDLMLFGINYGTDAGASAQALASNDVPDPAPNNILALHLPDIPGVGETFQANLVLASDGRIQGIQMPLVWDPAVVEPVSIQGGQLLTDQGGNSLVLSASPGVVDVCLAGVRESGISGVGTIASVTFQVLAAGNTQLQIADVDARGQDNSSVPVTTTAATPVGDDGDLPTVSALHLNYPNPFNPMTTISFDLAVPGRVRIDIYSIDGRRIRTLVDSPYTAGRHSEVWNGRDQSGRAVASGTYLYTMEGPAIRQTRRMLLIK